MIQIRLIESTEWLIAKRLVYRVAHTIFNDPRPLEESIAYYEARHELKDMDDIQKNYFEQGGIFYVMTENGQIIGTGAILQLTGDICELKRLWLLPEYHGQGLGYRTAPPGPAMPLMARVMSARLCLRAPAAISPTVCSLTAPYAARVCAETPSISCLASLV